MNETKGVTELVSDSDGASRGHCDLTVDEDVATVGPVKAEEKGGGGLETEGKGLYGPFVGRAVPRISHRQRRSTHLPPKRERRLDARSFVIARIFGDVKSRPFAGVEHHGWTARRGLRAANGARAEP